MMNKKGWVEGFCYSLLFVLFISLILFGLFGGIHIKTTENGRHTGQITAIETNGLFFKTISVYVKSDTQSSQEDRYCLIDKSLLPELEQYSKNKTTITIKYMDYLWAGFNECKNLADSGIIIGVEK